jgi:hypothetical protein
VDFHGNTSDKRDRARCAVFGTITAAQETRQMQTSDFADELSVLSRPGSRHLVPAGKNCRLACSLSVRPFFAAAAPLRADSKLFGRQVSFRTNSRQPTGCGQHAHFRIHEKMV